MPILLQRRACRWRALPLANHCHLLNLALEACEHYYPAFQFVLWGGKTAEDAIAAAVLECAGQA